MCLLPLFLWFFSKVSDVPDFTDLRKGICQGIYIFPKKLCYVIGIMQWMVLRVRHFKSSCVCLPSVQQKDIMPLASYPRTLCIHLFIFLHVSRLRQVSPLCKIRDIITCVDTNDNDFLNLNWDTKIQYVANVRNSSAITYSQLENQHL